MKFTYLYLLLICSPFWIQAQDQPSVQNYRQQEIKLNGLNSIFGIPEITYEHMLNRESSVGLSFAYSFTDRINQNYILTPFYRLFFGKQPASGFFVEGGLMIWSEEELNFFPRNPLLTDNRFFSNNNNLQNSIGGEVAIGWKLIDPEGWHIEFVVGFSRSFINRDFVFDQTIPRIGISVGKRFSSLEL